MLKIEFFNKNLIKKNRASEQPDENQILQQIQNEMSLKDTSQADICNEEEYNKIFHPKNEIKRSKFCLTKS